MRLLRLCMSLKLCTTCDADDGKWKYHFQRDKASTRIFQAYLWGHVNLWMLGNGDVLQAAIFSFVRGQESRLDGLPSVLSDFLYTLLGCSLSLLTPYELFFFWGAADSLGTWLTWKASFLRGREHMVWVGWYLVVRFVLVPPLRVELIVRIEIQVRTLLFCLGRF